MAVHALETVLEPPAEEEDPHVAPVDLQAVWDRMTELAAAARPLGVPAAPAPPKVVVRRVMPDREILATLSALGSVLTVRLMLAAAVVGAFMLAYLAISTPSIMAICVLVAYALTTVGPLTYLSTQRT